MNDKELFKRIKKESELKVPDMYDKILNSAIAEGLLEEASENAAVYSDGDTAVLGGVNKKAIAITTLAAVAGVCLAIALPVALSGNNGGAGPGGLPPVIEEPDPDDTVTLALGDDYAMGAVSTAKLLGNFISNTSATAVKAAAVSDTSSDAVSTFEKYFTSFDTFFGEKPVRTTPSKELYGKYANAIKVEGVYPDGMQTEYFIYYTESQVVSDTQSTDAVIDFVLDGAVKIGVDTYGISGSRSVTNDTAKTEKSLEIKVYDLLHKDDNYATMKLIRTGTGSDIQKNYSYSVVVGGNPAGSAVLNFPAVTGTDTAFALEIKDGNGVDNGKFTVLKPQDGKTEFNVNYIVGEENGKFTLKKTGDDYSHVLYGQLKYSVDNNKNVCFVSGVDSANSTLPANVVIPSDYNGIPVAGISGSAFAKHKEIEKVYLPDGIDFIGANAFESCTNLKSVRLPETLISIYEKAFYYCPKLEEINLPDGLGEICEQAFSNCYAIKDLNIPKSVAHVRSLAFYRCTGLESITVASDNPYLKSSGNCLINTRTNELLIGCKNSVIPADGSVVKIAECAFYEQAIESVTVPDSVKVIAQNAFYNCSDLSAITLPDVGLSIGRDAFTLTGYVENKNNWVGTELYIGKHLISVTPLYFGYRFSEDFYVRSGTLSIADYAIRSNDGMKRIILNKELKHIGLAALSYGEIEEISFTGENENYYVKGNCVIEKQTGTLVAGCMGSVIPADGSVKAIGELAFSDCRFTIITIPQGIESIGSHAFSNCTKLTSVTVPGSVKTIDVFAFHNCVALMSVVLEEGVETINSGAFLRCANLATVTLPSTVKYIGADIFENCDSVTTIYYNGTSEEWSFIENYTYMGAYNVICSDSN